MKATSKRTDASTVNEPQFDYVKIMKENSELGKKGTAEDLKEAVEKHRSGKLKKTS